MTLSKHQLIYRPYMINFLLLKMSLAIVIAKGGWGGGGGVGRGIGAVVAKPTCKYSV